MVNDVRQQSVDFWIITGQSGAGKTNVIRILEDWDYFCIDNLPPALLARTAQMIVDTGNIHRVALGIDVRGRSFFDSVIPSVKEMSQMGYRPRILYLEASTATLVKRFKETRRRHPMASEGKLLEDIQLERSRLEELRGMADVIIDTSELKINHLKDILETRIYEQDRQQEFNVYLVSFGYKYGIPLDADLVMDVRFLPNPYYDPALRPLTGLDPEVRDYVMNHEASRVFYEKYMDLLQYLIPNYIQEGKSSLVVAIGCTGGQHRSVTLAEKLRLALAETGIRTGVHHRDILRRQGGC